MLRTTLSAAAAQKAGFATTMDEAEAFGGDVNSEDAFADMFAQFALHLAGYRARRHLDWRVGYP
eukprot:8535480-Pyramimonas_sp.AAC.1